MDIHQIKLEQKMVNP